MNNIQLNHTCGNRKWLTETTKQKLKDLFINESFSTIENSNSYSNYRILKDTFGRENYIKSTLNTNIKSYIKYRTRNTDYLYIIMKFIANI